MPSEITAFDHGDEFSFAPFSRHPFFTHVNRCIVERVVRPERKLIVDLGCGPGAVTKLILERVGATGAEKDTRVVGIDPSPSALACARETIRSRVTEFVEGTAEKLSSIVSAADAVLFLNAVHLVPDKAKVFGEIRKALKPGGVLAFNTTFFNGAYVSGTAGFWRRWIVRAVQALRERGFEVKHEHKAVARDFLTADDYRELCLKSGFAAPTMELEEVEFTPESMADIARFSLFIEGAVPGVPLKAGCDALLEGLNRALDETKISGIPRNWLQAVAVAV